MGRVFTICTVSGWGTTTEGGSLARVLQKVDVPVVSDDHCRDSCTRTTTAGTSTTTFVCSLSRAQSAWDPTLEQSACPPAWKSTPRAPSAPFPDGEPPLRVEASPVFSRRSASLSCLTTTAVTPTDRPTSLTP